VCIGMALISYISFAEEAPDGTIEYFRMPLSTPSAANCAPHAQRRTWTAYMSRFFRRPQ
jgi:hypothetical protein